MAGPPKKKALQENDDDASSSDEDSGSEEYTGQQEIQADFEGRNPEGEDFHGIKKLLQQLFLKSHIDLSQMSDMLIAQTGIGSVLKQSFCDEDDDEDDEMDGDTMEVFGITSVINLNKRKESTCVKQLNTVVISQAMQHADKSIQDQVKQILCTSKVGFLVNERFLNIPPKISDPLLTSLMGELDRYKRKDTSYDFDYFLMVCKMHKPKGAGNDDFVYANAEEEVFGNESCIQFEFSVENESDLSIAGKWKEDDVEMIPYRKVILFKGSKFMNIVQQIKQFVN